MQHALEMLGLLLTLILSIWGLIKYFQAQIAQLHARINDVRKEYVHQDHMEGLLGGLGKSMDIVAEEQRRTNGRIDDILKMFANKTL